MQIAGILNGNNISYDYQFSLVSEAIFSKYGCVASGLNVTTGAVAAGKAIIKCTRTNGQVVMVSFHNTASVAIDTTGTKKVWVGVDQSKLDDGSLNSEDGTGIATIQTGASYPAGNYIPLASITSGTIADDRVIYIKRGVKGTSMASAATVDLSTADGDYIHITGTTPITSLGVVSAGIEIALIFDGILTLTHNATSLILPGAANITTAVWDVGYFVSEWSGNWVCVGYQKKDGTTIVTSVNITGQTENVFANPNDEFVMYDSVSLSNRKIKSKNVVAFEFWDGSDGDVTITTTVTLARDMQYTNLTINSWWILDPNGYKIYVAGTLTINSWGYIRRNWNAWNAPSGSNFWGLAWSALNQWSLNSEVAWGNGWGWAANWWAWTSTNPSYTNINWVLWWSSADWHTAWAIWTSTRGTLYNAVMTMRSFVLAMFNTPSCSTITFPSTQYKWPAWSSWGGGGSGWSYWWWWAWWNGGVIWLCVKNFNNLWAIESKWWAGWAGNWTTNSWWGGWWQGWVVYLIYRTMVNFGTITLTGWAWGSWWGTWNAWSTWNAGVTIQIQI